MSQSKEETLAWLKEFYTPADSLNAERFIKDFFTEDAILQFGNNPILQGHEDLIKMFTTFFGRLDLLRHEIEHFDVLPDRIYQYSHVVYTAKGDTELIRIPAFVALHKTPDERKIRRLDAFVDTSPLMAKLKSLGLI